MRIPRVYIDHALKIGQVVHLPKEIAEHLITVIKRKTGNNILLFNGQTDGTGSYGEYTAEIAEIKRNQITVVLLDYHAKYSLKTPSIELAQCISKSSHFEVSLQKSVELGVNAITPIISSRSEQIIKDDNILKKMLRWQKIIISACEQCGRVEVPKLNPPLDLGIWLDSVRESEQNQILLTLCTKTNNDIHHIDFKQNKLGKVRIVIGPEGGLDNSEISLLEESHFNLVKLGSRIMRTETASIASIAIVQYLLGNF